MERRSFLAALAALAATEAVTARQFQRQTGSGVRMAQYERQGPAGGHPRNYAFRCA
jgi:hypothetical protein